MAKIPGLQRRGLTWFLRVRVPQDLRGHFKNKEVIRTLETRDYNVAAKRVHTVRSGVEAEFEKKRQAIKANADNKDMLSGCSEHDLTALALKWLNDMRKRQEEQRIKDTEKWPEERARDYYTELQQEEQQAREEVLGVSQQEEHDGLTIAARCLKVEGISYDRNSENFRKLGHFFSKAIYELAQRNLREWQGKLHIPTDAAFAGSTGYGSFKPGKSIRMGELIKEFLSSRHSESTRKNYLIITRAINEIIGSETYVHHVTREKCKEISQLLMRLPSNAVKRTEVKSLVDAVKLGETKQLPKVADSTFNMYMQKLSALMEYAVREMYIPTNPAKGLYMPSAMKSKERRKPFKPEQLKAIFTSDIYLAQRDAALLYNAKSKDKAIYARFWMPLISLWTGMRLNEICQLYVSDITMIDNVHTITVQETDDEEETEKKVKTANAVRYVPIHPQLIKAGLLDYIKSVQAAGEKRLFSNLTLDKRGYYSNEFSKWFTRHLKSIKAKTPRTSFHSFRHTYRDAIRKAKLPRDAALQLGGWSSGATDDDYGEGLGPTDLYEEACKIKYEGLDLAHLYK